MMKYSKDMPICTSSVIHSSKNVVKKCGKISTKLQKFNGFFVFLYRLICQKEKEFYASCAEKKINTKTVEI